MKSMCQEARRNSPSVADCRPTSSCIRTAGDLLVLDRPQVSRRDPAGREVVARPQQSLRAQQAADVIGAERGAGPAGHGYLSCSDGEG